jgi:hypothetical protein
VRRNQATTEKEAPAYVPNAGFKLFDGEKGQIYMRLFTYVRYLDQDGLDPSYTDYFGNSHTVQQRQDIQLNKFFLPFSGWFLARNSAITSTSGRPTPRKASPRRSSARATSAITSTASSRSAAASRALPLDAQHGRAVSLLARRRRSASSRMSSFRGSYTSGVWLKGEITTTLKYMAMIGNNLSTLGVSAAKLDNKLDTTVDLAQWLPTTGEFGLYGTFGDYDWHEQLATRVGVHHTQSTEDKQSQPGSEDVENSQIRLTDGSNIFTPNCSRRESRSTRALCDVEPRRGLNGMACRSRRSITGAR